MQLSADHIGGLHGKGQGLVRGKGGHVGHLQLLPAGGHLQHQHDVAGALRGQGLAVGKALELELYSEMLALTAAP